MRIVIAHESLDTDGGVETYLVSVIRELSRRGHAIALVHDVPRRSGRPLATSADDRFCVSELGLDGAIARVRAWKPDVCFSHNIGPLAIDRALAGAWPVVKMLHGFFGTCVSGLKMHAFPSRRGLPANLRSGLPRPLRPAAMRPADARGDVVGLPLGGRAASALFSIPPDRRRQQLHAG